MNYILKGSAILNFKEQSKVLQYIKKYPSREGELAKKAYNSNIIITLAIFIIIIIPFIFYTISSIQNDINTNPYNASKEKSGRISLYEDTFWYTYDSQKYEFDLKEYNNGKTFEKGEVITIYMDDNNNIIAIDHQDDGSGIIGKILLMFAVPIVLLLFHAIVGKLTYCKWWYYYVQWYKKEIEPYSYQENFEEIVSAKKYYNVILKYKDFNSEAKKQYKKLMIKSTIYTLLIIIISAILVPIITEYDINTDSIIFYLIIASYVGPLSILVLINDEKMREIKTNSDNLIKGESE